MYPLDKSTVQILRGTVQDFITLLRTMCNLNLMNCFWNLLFNIFSPQLTVGKQTVESKTMDRENQCTAVPQLPYRIGSRTSLGYQNL